MQLGRPCMLIYFIVVVLCAFVLFLLSAVEEEGNSASVAKPYKYTTGSPCTSQDVFKQHRPFSVDFGGGDGSLTCTWSFRNSSLRMGYTLTGVIWGCLLIAAWCKRWVWFGYLSLLAYLTFALAAFGAMIMDARDVNESRVWCKEGLSGVEWKSGSYNPDQSCHYSLFIFIVLADFILFVMWLAQIALLWRSLRQKATYWTAASSEDTLEDTRMLESVESESEESEESDVDSKSGSQLAATEDDTLSGHTPLPPSGPPPAHARRADVLPDAQDSDDLFADVQNYDAPSF